MKYLQKRISGQPGMQTIMRAWLSTRRMTVGITIGFITIRIIIISVKKQKKSCGRQLEP